MKFNERVRFMFRQKAFLLAITALASVGFASWSSAADLEIGSKAPEFKATGVDGKEYSQASTKEAMATVIAFTCNQCPVAIAYEDRFIEFQKKYANKKVKLIAINVNSSEDLNAMKDRAEEKGLNYPYAYDETGDSARAFGAKVTPHLFVLDANGMLAYQGSFDDKQKDPTISYVEKAVEALLEGDKPEVTSTKAFGCGIRPNRK
ncbi:MAG: thioredoxin family protein [Pirellula sp.]|nr:thioredoxin family protein [Pirellula sp.]